MPAKSDTVFYCCLSVAVFAVALEFSFITQNNSPQLLHFWNLCRNQLQFLVILALCFAPYLLMLAYQFLFVPTEYVASLAESHDAPKNLMKRYKNSGPVPYPYPNGWFFIYLSDKLKKGDVKEISVVGKEFALFRGEDGTARAVSAFCPHLGANLAVGGTVQKNCITCPFHGWQFDGDSGKCVDIPYSKNIPSSASTKPAHVMEGNGVIYLWHHAEDEPPTWEVPFVDTIGTWKTRCDGYSQHEVCAHIQELPENGADVAHLGVLHTTPVVEVLGYFGFTHGWSAAWSEPTGENKHIAEISLMQCFRFLGYTIPMTTLDVSIRQIGPGIVILTFNTALGKAYLVQSVTPIEPMVQMTIHSVYMPWYIPRVIGKGLLGGLIVQVERDVPVWNNKTYVAKPLLCKGDGKIGSFRRWYSQFYSKSAKDQAKQNKSVLDW